jgi:uncharacterized protein (DUF58 family)
MNARRGGLALGVTALVAAIASGSRALGVVGVGFVFAAGVSWLWAWLADRPVTVDLAIDPPGAVEGDRVLISVDVQRRSWAPLGSGEARAIVGGLGERSCRLGGHGKTLRGAIDLGPVRRGVFAVSGTEVVLGDLLGLVSVAPRVVCEPATIVVRPRLATLDGLFSDTGRATGEARRVLLRRTAGFDFHSVREYEQGESLRRVHWPTSARRGQLMVKELEDTTHDGVVVVLDCDPRWTVGEPPDSSFDVAVRAAGSIVQAHAHRGRPVTLVSTGSSRTAVTVRSAADVEGAMSALAAADCDALGGVARFLRGDQPWAASGELVLVTGTTESAAFGEIVALAARRPVSVVWIDGASFAGRSTRAEPGLLRLAGHAVPTAVVRHGDDLAAVLSARTARAVAGG